MVAIHGGQKEKSVGRINTGKPELNLIAFALHKDSILPAVNVNAAQAASTVTRSAQCTRWRC